MSESRDQKQANAPTTMALPHYLTSGASSRAHYALLRKLDAAGTLHDADEAIREEVGRCRTVLEGNVSVLPLVVSREPGVFLVTSLWPV